MNEALSRRNMSEVWGLIAHGVEDMAQDRAQSRGGRKARVGGMVSGLWKLSALYT